VKLLFSAGMVLAFVCCPMLTRLLVGLVDESALSVKIKSRECDKLIEGVENGNLALLHLQIRVTCTLSLGTDQPSTSINLTSTCMHHSRRTYIPSIPVPRCVSQKALLVSSSLSIQPVNLSWPPYDHLHLSLRFLPNSHGWTTDHLGESSTQP